MWTRKPSKARRETQVNRLDGFDPKESALALVYKFALLARFVFDDIARDSAGRYSQRRSKIHLPRAAAPGKVPVLRADHDLIRPRGNSRSSVNARATTRFNDLRSRFLKNVQIAPAQA